MNSTENTRDIRGREGGLIPLGEEKLQVRQLIKRKEITIDLPLAVSVEISCANFRSSSRKISGTHPVFSVFFGKERQVGFSGCHQILYSPNDPCVALKSKKGHTDEAHNSSVVRLECPCQACAGLLTPFSSKAKASYAGFDSNAKYHLPNNRFRSPISGSQVRQRLVAMSLGSSGTFSSLDKVLKV
jgi:hypothetical protein